MIEFVAYVAIFIIWLGGIIIIGYLIDAVYHSEEAGGKTTHCNTNKSQRNYYDDFSPVNAGMNKKHVLQYERTVADIQRQMEWNHDKVSADFQGQAIDDHQVAVFTYEQACDMAQHDHDAHTNMFNDVGCANPFF